MTTFRHLQRAVGEWSERQFGEQSAVNPLLGVGEEYGELVDQLDATDRVTAAEHDCVGDMLVFMADFCHRRGHEYQAAFEADGTDEFPFEDPLDGVAAAIGALDRSVLKRRQGIRLDDDRVGAAAERRALAAFLDHLGDFANRRGYSLETCIDVAWHEEVRHREWDGSSA
ncbi:hypothetical protein Halru_0261 [Halovivax ruber XH-70]|uniref:MazG nucleotide pyrophosphohydrolase family protein n=1 Tax=Halovivax ruber (strain DSM 18193 / JCM 13892 / XH-70) TaxID=797302 RepID=L0IAE0_HALRX|nr:hypothetical protein [Halovivax ruber]AGB14907.1 hypothetical protein Halru_0261 [Halovivax ruber XH-70]